MRGVQGVSCSQKHSHCTASRALAAAPRMPTPSSSDAIAMQATIHKCGAASCTKQKALGREVHVLAESLSLGAPPGSVTAGGRMPARAQPSCCQRPRKSRAGGEAMVAPSPVNHQPLQPMARCTPPTTRALRCCQRAPPCRRLAASRGGPRHGVGGVGGEGGGGDRVDSGAERLWGFT